MLSLKFYFEYKDKAVYVINQILLPKNYFLILKWAVTFCRFIRIYSVSNENRQSDILILGTS